MYKLISRWGYWDGPLSGLCEYEGQICWYANFVLGGWELIDETWDGDAEYCNRMYRVYTLPRYKIKIIEMANKFFSLSQKYRSLSSLWYRLKISKIIENLTDPKKLKLVGAFSEDECFRAWA